MPHKNLAVELLRKLLNDEVKARSKRNLVQARSFAEKLEKAVRRYQNRAIETAQVIEELIALAKEMRAARRRGETRPERATSWPSTTRSRSTTAPSRCSATRRCAPSRASWSTR
jgi:type I site-specific restriction-modification system R (restriction) subunit